ncbi:MAG: hypothetical protein IPP32_05865 [Bacteroidetes bacterium]|nr:hypothetical protein [Bacteroidota bacterium]
MRTLDQIISAFQPITLAEMDSVKLMDRTDTKFVFHVQDLDAVLSDISKHYRALEVEGTRWSPYETLYYDTPGLRIIYPSSQSKIKSL